MIQDIIEAKLQSALQLEHGETLFRNTMPAACSIGVMTRFPLQGIPYDAEMPEHYRGQIQVITRHTDPQEGKAFAMSIKRALHTEKQEFHAATQERGDTVLHMLIPVTLPIDFPRLDGNGYEWSQHFKFLFRTKQA